VSPLKVSHSFVKDWIFSYINGTGVITHERNSIKDHSKVSHGVHNPYDLGVAATLKDRRRRLEGGGEWESIKIPRRNLTYIPKSARRPSLLTRPRPYSYSKAIDLWNRVRNRSRNTNRCWHDHVQDRRQKLSQRAVYILAGISLNTLWACSGDQLVRAIGTRKPRAF
jgi:hypothetical protein